MLQFVVRVAGGRLVTASENFAQETALFLKDLVEASSEEPGRADLVMWLVE